MFMRVVSPRSTLNHMGGHAEALFYKPSHWIIHLIMPFSPFPFPLPFAGLWIEVLDICWVGWFKQNEHVWRFSYHWRDTMASILARRHMSLRPRFESLSVLGEDLTHFRAQQWISLQTYLSKLWDSKSFMCFWSSQTFTISMLQLEGKEY